MCLLTVSVNFVNYISQSMGIDCWWRDKSEVLTWSPSRESLTCLPNEIFLMSIQWNLGAYFLWSHNNLRYYGWSWTVLKLWYDYDLIQSCYEMCTNTMWLLWVELDRYRTMNILWIDCRICIDRVCSGWNLLQNCKRTEHNAGIFVNETSPRFVWM